jgi:hypothetical protein
MLALLVALPIRRRPAVAEPLRPTAEDLEVTVSERL